MCIFCIIQPCISNVSGKTDKTEEAEMTCHTDLEVYDRLLKEGYYMSLKRKLFFLKSYFYVSFCARVNDNL